jgi:hypothetical protein
MYQYQCMLIIITIQSCFCNLSIVSIYIKYYTTYTYLFMTRLTKLAQVGFFNEKY